MGRDYRRYATLAVLALTVSLVLAQAALAAGTWTATGSLANGRREHTATLLPNGQVLVAGGLQGTTDLASCELYDPATGTWSPTGSLAVGRTAPTATLLPNGQVLVAGGSGVSGGGSTFWATCELYDPAAKTWSPTTGSLAAGRNLHTATLLPNGQVLVAGGEGSSGALASSELFDPATGTWSPTGSLANARFWHTATLLPNGQVLVAGGLDSLGSALSSAELYTPATKTWSSAGLVNARFAHTSTLLPNGQVLTAGGEGAGFLANAELFDPATNTSSLTGSIGYRASLPHRHAAAHRQGPDGGRHRPYFKA